MVVNTHCHIFNLQSVFTMETKGILRDRIIDEGFTDALADAVIVLLEFYLKEGGGLNPLASMSERSEALLEVLSTPSVARRLAPKAADRIHEVVGLLPHAMDKGIHDLFGDVLAVLDMDTAYTPQDILAFLSIALAEDIDFATDSLMEQMGEDDIIVPLMMDITDGKGDDDSRFSKHVEDTKRQCLRYPGRILPFYALNPIRKNGADRLKAVIQEGAFVGVKLYPSLGYRIEEVLDICKICNEADFPIIQHCSRNGFFKDVQFKEYCDPNIWRPYLMRGEQIGFEKLKVCFAHFGGEEAHLVDASLGPGDSPANWAATILGMIRGEGAGSPGVDRVFTDLSHHNGARKVSGYFKAVRKLLTDETVCSQILWGTDYFLLQRYVSDSNYAKVFKRQLERNGLWERLTRTNPLRFIGLELGDPFGRSGQNIQNHIKFLERMSSELQRDKAAVWVKQFLG
jgi:predicted TIM-barrel fold metal-dependent hydrolase